MSIMTTAAIYARKSVLTETGESIENQVRRGIAYCEVKGWDYIIYDKDEGFSGSNTDRPDFERMMRDAENKKFQYIISYKLDRISRSVLDFSDFIEKLNELDIGYISLTENFDTTTPVGRAMMMIIAVFAQLEREQIAERVRDNMIDRAKLGKWNGGPVPFGYDVEKKELIIDGKKKKVSKLVINESEAEKIKKYVEWYLSPGGSIRKNVFRANSLGEKTKAGSVWGSTQMRRILESPLYVKADEDVYNYFLEKGIYIVSNKEMFNGKNGIILYNKRKPYKKTSRKRNKEEWILSVGEHEGIIPGKIFIEVQEKLNKNYNKPPRSGSSTKSFLSGLVKCGCCGKSMVVYAGGNEKVDNNYKYTYFRCSSKIRQGLHCENDSVRTEELENVVINELKKISLDKNFIESAFKETSNKSKNDNKELLKKKKNLEDRISDIDKQINNLVEAVANASLPQDLIKAKYEEYAKAKKEIQNELEKLNENISITNNNIMSADYVYSILKDLHVIIDTLSFDEKKTLFNNIIQKIVYDRGNVEIQFFILPIYRSSKDLVISSRKDMDLKQ